jgi:hypothetical protein
VLFVVEGELLDGLVAGDEFVEFVREVPLATAPRTRDRREVVDRVHGGVGVVGSGVVGHT